jgi:CheY-like chemotaxis protein
MQGDKERCLACGMDGYVSKPIKLEELFLVIENRERCSRHHSRVRHEEYARNKRGFHSHMGRAIRRPAIRRASFYTPFAGALRSRCCLLPHGIIKSYEANEKAGRGGF